MRLNEVECYFDGLKPYLLALDTQGETRESLEEAAASSTPGLTNYDYNCNYK